MCITDLDKAEIEGVLVPTGPCHPADCTAARKRVKANEAEQRTGDDVPERTTYAADDTTPVVVVVCVVVATVAVAMARTRRGRRVDTIRAILGDHGAELGVAQRPVLVAQ